jgi:hypothetical protein
VTRDHTDTAQVLSADQNPALVQASATVKVNVWSLDIAKAVTGTRGRLPGWTPPPGRANSIRKSTTCSAGPWISPNSCSIRASIRIVMFLAQT